MNAAQNAVPEIATAAALQCDDNTQSRVDFLLASMRLAIANLRSWQLELDFIGVALSRGMISLDNAVDELDELGLLQYLPPREARC